MGLLRRPAIFFIAQHRFRLYARAFDDRPPAHFAGYTLDLIAIIPGIHTALLALSLILDYILPHLNSRFHNRRRPTCLSKETG
jgi:hypothetical protein